MGYSPDEFLREFGIMRDVYAYVFGRLGSGFD